MNFLKKTTYFIDFSILSFSFFPLYPNRLKGLPVILLFLSSLLFFLKQKKRNEYPFKQVISFTSLFLILFISLIYTTNFNNIDKILSTRLSLLFIPISFGFLRYTGYIFIFFDLFLKLLIIFSSIFTLSIFLYLFKLGYFSGKMTINEAISYINNEMWYINQHPIYISIFISITIILTIVYIFVLNKKFSILLSPLYLSMIYLLLLLERKGIFISLITCVLFFFVVRFKFKLLKLNVSLLFVLIFSFLYMSGGRFKEMYVKETFASFDKNSSTSIRFSIYKCVLKKIKESPLIGYGIGDVKEELNKCYREVSDDLVIMSYNSHNQYFSYVLSVGLFGFFIICYLVLNLVQLSLNSQNLFLLLLTVFFGLTMLFENILERQSGVIPFSFYLCFFSYHNFLLKEINNEV